MQGRKNTTMCEQAHMVVFFLSYRAIARGMTGSAGHTARQDRAIARGMTGFAGHTARRYSAKHAGLRDDFSRKTGIAMALRSVKKYFSLFFFIKMVYYY